MENILVTDMIHLHKKTGEVIYSDLLKETLKVSKLQSTKRNIENQLRKERVQNEAHLQQIKKLQGHLLTADCGTYKRGETQKLLTEKENAIQLLNKKLNNPATQLIQASELIELEKENKP